jgi:GNAT superfamily N-acetyltransferase
MADNIQFSPAQKAERNEIIDFLSMVFEGEYKRDDIESDVNLAFEEHIFKYHFFVGKEDGKIVCLGSSKKSGLEKDLWGIAWVAVDPKLHKHGYGRRMVEHLIHRFASEKLSVEQGTIILSAKKRNHTFYEKLGFGSVESYGCNRLFYKTIERPAGVSGGTR